MRAFAMIALLTVLLAPTLAFAVTPDEVLKDPALEARARDLSRELRCMVCQNQSIDDSEAPLAKDLRVLVRERLSKGDSDNQVLDFLVARYGNFVLLRPPLELHTLLLWGLPPVALLAGLTVLIVLARRRKVVPAPAGELNEAEQRRLSTLVEPDAGGDH
ncbi:MAG: cytochrome c-type biogenesis protein CcmH [Deltaproteobacteria bacterium]|nr:cytochrome c-type biogenesis protein CcmH [Deltaproteobacteria bacterium]